MICALTFNVIKIFSLAAFASIIAILWCPLLTHYLYKYKFWKKTARQKAISGEDAVVFNSLHKDKEVGTPQDGRIADLGNGGFCYFYIFRVIVNFSK